MTDQSVKSPAGTGSTDGERMHWVLNTGFTVSVPVDAAWAVFKDHPSWDPYFTWKVADGDPYDPDEGLREGQTMELTQSKVFPGPKSAPLAAGAENIAQRLGPNFIVLRVVRVVPEQEIVKVLFGRTQDWQRYTVVYVYRLKAAGQGTEISIDTYGEGELVDSLSADDFAVYMQEFTESWHAFWPAMIASYKERLGLQS